MSQKSTAEKLGVKNGNRVLVLGAPAGYSLGALPPDSRVVTQPGEEADLAQVFVSSMSELKQRLSKLKADLRPHVPIWVTYPKGSSKVKTDLNRDVVREYASTAGLQAVALFAVDETWSALRLKHVNAAEGKAKR
jgi:hypothetical protein